MPLWIHVIDWHTRPSPDRPRTGHVYQHGDHWDLRIRLADGKRGKPQHLDPRVTEEQARDLAAHASAMALAEGTTHTPRPQSGETADAWLDRWTADRRARGLTTGAQSAGRGASGSARSPAACRCATSAAKTSSASSNGSTKQCAPA